MSSEKIKKRKVTKVITKRLRLSNAEWLVINDKLQESGLTFSKFALRAMLSKQIYAPIMRELLAELSRHGQNMNQIAAKLNSGQSLDRVGIEIIADDNDVLHSNWLGSARNDIKGRSSLDDTKTMEIQPTYCRQDPEGILHINSKRRRDNRERAQEIYINENGVEDDSIRESIARRERALDQDDRRRKEQTRIRNNEFATRLREGACDITDKCDSANKESQELEQRLQRRLNGIFAATKNMYESSISCLEEKLENLEEKFQNLREEYESLQIEHKMLQEYVENL